MSDSNPDAPAPDDARPASETPETAKPGETSRSAFTLDLSTSAGSARPKRPKGFVPVVQKTINLTTKRTEAPAEAPEPTQAEAPRPDAPQRSGNAPQGRGRRDDGRRDDNRRGDGRRDARDNRGDNRGGGRPSGGTSLADLLDEATLARLRGEG